jgi:plasmid stabilization system protein ParE
LGRSKSEDKKEGLVLVKILDAAEQDLEEGYHFYEQQSSGLGSYFLDSLYSDIDSLMYFGGTHSVVYGYYRLLARRFPFAVYYKMMDDYVVVTAILDCRRNPSWIRERLIQGTSR